MWPILVVMFYVLKYCLSRTSPALSLNLILLLELMSHQSVPIAGAADQALACIFSPKCSPAVYDFACAAIKRNFPAATTDLNPDENFGPNATTAIAAEVRTHLRKAHQYLGPEASARCIKTGFEHANLAQAQVSSLATIRAQVKLEDQRQHLLLDYRYAPADGSGVVFRIPDRVSILELYDRAEKLRLASIALGADPGQMVYATKLVEWRKAPAFNLPLRQSNKIIRLQAAAPGTSGHNKSDQTSEAAKAGKKLAAEWQVAAAFILNFCANPGGNLFGGYDVRTEQATLAFSSFLGLKDSIFLDQSDDRLIAAAFVDID